MDDCAVLSASSVAVVVPARNEARSIRAVAGGCLAHASVVIVIDDASSDGTAAALQGLPVTLLRSDVRLGKGGALARGFAAAVQAGAQAVITVDGDGQHDPADIPAFIAAANRYPCHLILGARTKQRQRAPRARLWANRIADFWISWAAGQAVRDTQCGHRLYPAELLRGNDVPATLPRGFVFESEMLIAAAWRGFPVVSLPIESRYPPQARASHFRPAQDIWAITCMVFWKIVGRGLYPVGLVRSLVTKPKTV